MRIQRIVEVTLVVLMFIRLFHADLLEDNLNIVLAEPVNEQVSYMPHPNFHWYLSIAEEVDLSEGFIIEISKDPEFQNIVDHDRIASVITHYVPTQPMATGIYWWRIAKINDIGKQDLWSKVGKFEIREPENHYKVKRTDSFEQIRQTIQKASANTPAKVIFEPDVYQLSPEEGATFVELRNTEDLIIDGNGAEIIFGSFVSYVQIEYCKRILIRNFIFDLDPLPYTAGTVLSVNPKECFFDMEIASGHPLPESQPAFERDRRGMIMDSTHIRMKEGVSLVFSHQGWKKLEDRRYRFMPANKKQLSEIKPGDMYVLDPRQILPFRNKYSDQTTFYNLIVHAASNECFTSHYANRHAIIACEIQRLDGRYIAANNGGHNHHNARIGPWIEGCLFENTGDDICHVNTLTLGVESQPSPDCIRLFLDNPHDYGRPVGLDIKPGDHLIFFNRDEGFMLAERKVVSIVLKDDTLEVKLDRGVKGIRPGQFTTRRVGHARVPNEPAVTQVFNTSRACNQFVFRNNTVFNGRRVGVLAKGKSGLIENNIFEGLGGGGIEFWNAPYEGPGAKNYVVRNNKIRNCGLLDRYDAPIWMNTFKSGQSRLHSNILIENNQISGFNEYAMRILDAENILIKNNSIDRSGQESKYGSQGNVFMTSNVMNVIYRENTIDPPTDRPVR